VPALVHAIEAMSIDVTGLSAEKAAVTAAQHVDE
jgi:hypothetical protein